MFGSIVGSSRKKEEEEEKEVDTFSAKHQTDALFKETCTVAQFMQWLKSYHNTKAAALFGITTCHYCCMVC